MWKFASHAIWITTLFPGSTHGGHFRMIEFDSHSRPCRRFPLPIINVVRPLVSSRATTRYSSPCRRKGENARQMCVHPPTACIRPHFAFSLFLCPSPHYIAVNVSASSQQTNAGRISGNSTCAIFACFFCLINRGSFRSALSNNAGAETTSSR
jgi:hypothetical protein